MRPVIYLALLTAAVAVSVPQVHSWEVPMQSSIASPAPAAEVLAHLLNGSGFNFLILSSSTDPGALDRVILSSLPDGPMPSARPQAQALAEDDDEAEAQARVAPPTRPVPPAANANNANDGQAVSPDMKAPPNNDGPD